MDGQSRSELSSHTDLRLAMPDPDAGWQPDAPAAWGRFRTAQTNRRRRARRVSWAAAIVAVGALGLTSVPGSRALAARCIEACVELTSRAMGASPTRDSGVDAATLMPVGVRAEAPGFSLADSTGNVVRLDALRGQVVLLNFWATWCGPCTVEMPWFAEFRATHQADGLAVVGVSLDESGWDAVRPFAAAHPVWYPLTLGTDALTSSYGGIDALPSTFLIDRHGRIAARHVGLIPKATYERQIAALLAER